MRSIKIYFAGPLFSESERDWVRGTIDRIKTLVAELGAPVEIIWPFELFSPGELDALGDKAQSRFLGDRWCCSVECVPNHRRDRCGLGNVGSCSCKQRYYPKSFQYPAICLYLLACLMKLGSGLCRRSAGKKITLSSLVLKSSIPACRLTLCSSLTFALFNFII